MKKQNKFLWSTMYGIIGCVVICLLAACTSSIDEDGGNILLPDMTTGYNYYPPLEPEVLPPTVHRSPPNDVSMEVELINNTNSSVTITSYQFYDGKYGLWLCHNFWETHHADAQSKNTFQFSWQYHEPIFSIPSDLEGMSNAPHWQPFFGENVVSRFLPHMNSFMLELTIDGTAYYLAGWPSSQILPEKKELYQRVEQVLDRRRIIQYGIGYADNKEAYVNEFGCAVIPLNISYEDQQRTVVENLGTSWNTKVTGKAVLTIDAPNKINYRTVSLFPHTNSTAWTRSE